MSILVNWTHAGVSYEIRRTADYVGVLMASDGRMVPVGCSDRAAAEWLGAGDAKRTEMAELALSLVER